MNSLCWRYVLVCVLAFAIPFQAIAASGFLTCGPGHNRLQGLSSFLDATPRTIHRQAPQAKEHHPGMAGHGASHQVYADLPADDSSSLGSMHKSAQSKCQSCAPCCTGTVLVGEFSFVLEPSSFPPDFPPVQPLYAPLRAGSLERPPRSILA